MTIETPDLIDALPLIDTELDGDETLRQLVMKMVADEASESQSPACEIGLPNRSFLTQRLRDELVRWEQNKPHDRLAGLSKIESDNPPASNDLDEESLKSWIRCLDQVKIKLEYRQRQLSNIEILKANGKTAWEQYLSRNETLKSKLDEELRSIGGRIQYINAERKSSQDKISRHLDVLQTDWDNLSIRNQMLSEEIERLRKEISSKTQANESNQTA